MGSPFTKPDVETIPRQKEKLQAPRQFKVLLHNDDYTSMEFVVRILKAVFHKNEAEATAIMLKVHQEGVGVCGIYPREVAETKAELVKSLARRDGFPLLCTIEEV